MERAIRNYGLTEYIEWTPKIWNGHVLVFLHGLGQCGKTWEQMEKEGLPKLLKAGYESNCIIIYTKLPAGATSWGKTPLTKLSEILTVYPAKGYHMTGLSLGAMGTLSFMKYFPGMLKTAGICCGKSSVTLLENMVPTQIKAWHGIYDDVLPITSIRQIVAGLNKLGNKAVLIEYNDDHSIWDHVYNPANSNGFWPWFNNRAK